MSASSPQNISPKDKPGLALRFEMMIRKRPDVGKQLRYLTIRCLLAFFLTISYCVLGGLVFKFVEGDQEATYTCGRCITKSPKSNNCF